MEGIENTFKAFHLYNKNNSHINL